VSALRLIDEPTVDGRIGEILLGDGDGRVRSEAVFAATYRALDPMLPVLQGALQRDPESHVRLRVIELLGLRRGESASCDPLLAWAAQHDRDPEVRKAASQALGA
jgi:HEAT repeat protein